VGEEKPLALMVADMVPVVIVHPGIQEHDLGPLNSLRGERAGEDEGRVRVQGGGSGETLDGKSVKGFSS
jgi:hypothetical protein